jgi:hypothetical protein
MKRSISFAALGLLASLACLAKEPLAVETQVEVSAKVLAIDPETRLISMQGPGGPMSVVAGPEVRNFDQIHVGDKMVVKYRQALAAKITKSKATPTTTETTLETAAPLGAKPSGEVIKQISTTVIIESVDRSFDTVTFKMPDGSTRVTAVASPEGKKFIRTLHRGDKVDVTFTDAVATSIVAGE